MILQPSQEAAVKQVISISLGSSANDYQFETEFLGQDFIIKRFGTDGDMEKAAGLLLKWDKEADAIGLGNVKFPYGLGPRYLIKKHHHQLRELGAQIETPVTIGSALREVSFEWALRYIEYKFGNYFDNARVLFLSGMSNYRIAKVMSEFTENLSFADPVLENGIPKFVNSLKDLKSYAHGAHEVLQWVPSKRLTGSVMPLKAWNDYILSKAMQKADIIVVPFYDFDAYLENAGLEELGGKTIITSTVYDDRVAFLKERGVDVIIDTTPKILQQVVAPNVLAAMIIAALGKKRDQILPDDLLEIISEQKMDPRVVYPSGSPKRVNRFAFVIHPLSKEFLKKDKAVCHLELYPPGVSGCR
jgi:hypothetical protein